MTCCSMLSVHIIMYMYMYILYKCETAALGYTVNHAPPSYNYNMYVCIIPYIDFRVYTMYIRINTTWSLVLPHDSLMTKRRFLMLASPLSGEKENYVCVK